MKRILKQASLFVIPLVFLASCQSADTSKKIYQEDGVALQGYDLVAYQEAEKPTPGKAEFAHTHEGVTYYFGSAENLEKFKAEPKKYLPAYGGWCAYAVSLDRKMAPNPETFKVSDGKLYLFYNSWGNNTLNKWNKDEPVVKAKADSIWQTMEHQ